VRLVLRSRFVGGSGIASRGGHAVSYELGTKSSWTLMFGGCVPDAKPASAGFGELGIPLSPPLRLAGTFRESIPGKLWSRQSWMPPADSRARAVRIPIRGGGEDMNRRKLSHVIVAGILAALLVLPGPALAQATHHRGPVDFWSWLAGLWSRGVSTLGSGSGIGLKQCLGIDPNCGGSTGSSTPTGTTSGATTPGDQGHGIDPNG